MLSLYSNDTKNVSQIIIQKEPPSESSGLQPQQPPRFWLLFEDLLNSLLWLTCCRFSSFETSFVSYKFLLSSSLSIRMFVVWFTRVSVFSVSKVFIADGLRSSISGGSSSSLWISSGFWSCHPSALAVFCIGLSSIYPTLSGRCVLGESSVSSTF